MTSVHDVVAYILDRKGSMSSWKLQKLVYYCQAWHLAWDGEPMFNEPIEAWANGPVVKALYDKHRGRFTVDPPWEDGNPTKLTEQERGTVDAVLGGYGDMTGRQLSLLTHSEDPWRMTRGDLASTASSRRRIPPEEMFAFYSALDADATASAVTELDWEKIER